MPESPLYISQIRDKTKQAQTLSGSHFYIHAFRNKLTHGRYVKHFPLSKIRAWHNGYVQLLAKKFKEKHPNQTYVHESPIR